MTAPEFTATKATALMALAYTHVCVRMGMQVRTLMKSHWQLNIQLFTLHTKCSEK